MLRSRLLVISKNSGIHTACRAKGTVGFIGLGNMGSHMAQNLLQKGHSVAVFDVVPEAVSVLTDRGATRCQSPAEVASLCHRIVSMLPNSEHVREVYTGDEGVFQKVEKDTILIDSSTIDPMVTRQLADTARDKHCVFMDAPVSGGVNAARGGTLTFMVGAERQESFETAKQLLSSMGSNVVHCGPVSSGQAAKICNNMLLAISMIGTSEAMSLGIKLGLKPDVLASIICSSSGRCWSADSYNPVPGVMSGVPASNNYQGGFGTALMCKDLGLAQAAATSVGACTPLGAASLHLYRHMVSRGLGKLDFSAVYQLLSADEK